MLNLKAIQLEISASYHDAMQQQPTDKTAFLVFTFPYSLFLFIVLFLCVLVFIQLENIIASIAKIRPSAVFDRSQMNPF